MVHGEPPDANGWHGGITRQTPRFVGRKVNERNTRGGQRVVCGYLVRNVFDSHEAISDTAADVLRHLSLEITIKRVFTAAKSRALMFAAELLQTKGKRHHSPSSSRRR